MIAGFEGTTAGTIHLYGQEIEHLPPDKRPVNTVFQNYALFPHMNVAENIGFALQMLGWSKPMITARVAEMIEMVQLGAFAQRKPSQLSGGQQQRVALARAMAPRPKVLLLDEPLSALDLKLRQEMRSELKRLQRDTGITFIFVTHDQEEALSMSDRIAVMSAGKLQQIGTPNDIYEHPSNRFVADFIGETNLLEATVQSMDGRRVMCRLADGEVLHALANAPQAQGARGVVSIRPEQVRVARTAPEGDALHGTLGEAVYLGTDTQYTVHLGGALALTVRMQNSFGEIVPLRQGDPVFVSIADGAARFLVD
jgi:spermidine/putrescine transport system ATP-binding protein